MTNNYILMNGFVYESGCFALKHVHIKADKIVAFYAVDQLQLDPTAQQIDMTHKYVLPGFIDMHIHLREPGFEYKETIASGTRAAAVGGYTQVYAMPNTNPPMDRLDRIQQFNDLVAQHAVVKTKTFAAITENLRSDTLVDFEVLADASVIGFSNDGVGVQTANIMYEAMQKAQKLNRPISAHCEDDSLLYGGALHHGERAEQLGVKGLLGITESVQIARDVLLAEATGCHYHVCHVSTKESVRLIRDAKKAGINVSAEVTPHHLLLTEADIPDTQYENYKMNPPLRSKEDQLALIEGLQDGTIDFIATDHAPHSEADKQGDIYGAAFGIIGLEHAFSLLYTAFVRTNKWTLSQLVEWLSYKPSQVFQLSGGDIRLDSAADIVVMDLEATSIITPPFISKSSNTPFIGTKVFSKTIMTIVDGNIVYQSIE